MLLTDEEKSELINTAPCRYDLVENVIAAYEAKLREQEPIIWITPDGEGWQPIETAPKDGSRVLIKGDCTVVAGWEEITGMFGLMGWVIVNGTWLASSEVRYWMPLPKPPMAAARSGE